MNMVLTHVFGLILLAITAITGFYLVRYPHRGLKHVISVHGLGRLEGTLENLKRVIVVADHVEPPSNELRQAVTNNFKRGVKYQFLISESKAPDELDRYYRFFEALADIHGGLVGIEQLPYDWLLEPFVFYEIEDVKLSSRKSYLAVKGNQKLEGIADYYVHLDPPTAHMWARAILSGAPQPITVRREEFVDGSKVIELDQRRHRA